MGNTGSKLKRARQPMPSFVEKALRSSNLFADYYSRPEYQQNDYLGWINQAKKQETKEKRMQQMLDELEKGGVYMKMSHPASAKQ